MSFMLRKDARKWFEKVREKAPWKTDFDSYYFCLMAGLGSGKKSTIPAAELAELIDYFPEDFKKHQNIIIALFLKVEIRKDGIGVKERSAVNEAIRKRVRVRSETGLSSKGMSELNRYAHAGFEIIRDWFGDRPYELETFISIYTKNIAKLKFET